MIPLADILILARVSWTLHASLLHLRLYRPMILSLLINDLFSLVLGETKEHQDQITEGI